MHMDSKQTKIVATISDRNCDVELLKTLYDNGMNVVRLNTAHQGPDDTLKVVNNTRAVSDKIALLVDTKGPEVRTKDIDGKMEAKIGDIIYIGDYSGDGRSFQVNYDDFVKEVPVGSQVLIDDGSLIMNVTDKNDKYLTCEVQNNGVVGNKKSVNTPNVHLNVPALTEKDKMYVQFAIEHELDFIAHSFVRNKKDVEVIQGMLDAANSKCKIIAKIENREGVDNIEEIIDCTYGIMIARGDLGVEIPGEEVPVVQKKIISLCMRKAKPVITATQMLHTMIENPLPTRAEISDVANAIFDGTDAVMLSGETAYGDYPIEAVQTMTRIAKMIESEKPKLRDLPVFEDMSKTRNYLAKCAVSAALELPVKAMVIDSASGYSARTISAYRGHVPVYAKCHDKRVARELMLSYGIYPSYIEADASTDELVRKGLQELVDAGKLTKEDMVVVLAGIPANDSESDLLEINTVDVCLKSKMCSI